jgi:DNA-binding CsgD family transcriptional regulator/tetratricopeptide (TPR) repeat protein
MRTPTRSPHRTRAPLVGREAELEELLGLLDAAFERGSVRLIHGDPGVGKSALLTAAASSARDRGMVVLEATGAEFEAQMPFSGLHQLLEEILDEAPELIPEQRAALRDALGSAGHVPDTFLVALATLSLLGDCAARAPILLIADDAHWLDPATVDVLRFVARRLEADPIVMLISYRDWFGSAFEVTDLPTLAVRGLEAAAAAALLDFHWPDLEPHLRASVLNEADGNPLALLELPSAWRGQSANWSTINDVPLTGRLERAFGVHVAGLPAATRSLLLIAALNDKDALVEILQAASLVEDEASALESLEIAEGAGLVSSDGRVLRFRHPLIRAAVRQQAGASERWTARSALATVLESQPDRSVWHLAANASGPDETLAAWLELTASRARQRRGSGLALIALRRSAELTPSVTTRGGRLLAAAELALELGRQEDVAELLREAEALELAQKERRCILWLREALAEANGSGTVESMITVANKLISDGDVRLALNALLTAALKCHQFNADAPARESVARAADRLAVADTDAKRLAIYGLADPSERGPEIARRLARTSPGDLMGPETDAMEASEGLHMCALALTMVPEFQLAAQFHATAIEGFRSQGRLGLLSRALASHAVTGLALGDWRLATQAAEECVRIAPEVQAPAPQLPTRRGDAQSGRRELDSGTARLVLGAVAANRGDFEAADELISGGARVLGPLGANFGFAMIQAARAAAALARGSYVEAYEHAGRIFDRADPAYHWQVGRWRSVVIDMVDAAWLSGHERQAHRLLASLESGRNCDEFRWTLRYARFVLGQDSQDELTRAITGEGRPATAFIHGRIELARGIRIRRRRRSKEARPHLRAAFETFEAVGADPWAERASQELRASGETLRRMTPVRRDELSPQELQIASLAADGLTNREIGAKLFLSHRTVGAHLYRVFPKLGVTSRSELGAALESLSRSG